VEILIQETLAIPNGIQELQFTDPVATAENFVTMRFFFPVENWLQFYKAIVPRATIASATNFWIPPGITTSWRLNTHPWPD
jgi:cupin superfamily acireductone dioxygenase involved in methionine salvage